MNSRKHDLLIVGGGLAGCEAAMQAANLGLKVKLVEMRPYVNTGAHSTDYLAELVCSNSLGSNLPDRASGLLKNELRLLGSYLIAIADKTSIPAGRALAVDRTLFATRVTEMILKNKNIDLVRSEVSDFPLETAIIATGPLTSTRLAKSISEKLGQDNLYFYDAIAPVLLKDSVDFEIAFIGSRYETSINDQGDYINLPFTKEQYFEFISLLKKGERIPLKSFENQISGEGKNTNSKYFEGCLPVEILASRGDQALAFGPMRPVGLINPHTNSRPYAVIQLRRENVAGDLYNMVGFQTNLSYSEQIRIFHTIPGLENAEFIRLGSMHRNTFINSPNCINPTLELQSFPGIFIAGQLSGIEGYVGNIASGLIAGLNAYRLISGKNLLEFPVNTMVGALSNYIASADSESFQPMKANFGLLPALEVNAGLSKRERYTKYAERSLLALDRYFSKMQTQ